MNTIPVINMTATGANIARLRQGAGISVRQLQTIFGFSKWQRGQALPTLDNIIVLAAALGVTVDEILVCDPSAHGTGIA